jgi:hypothetical protein
MAALFRSQLASPTLKHALDSPSIGMRHALDGSPLRPASPTPGVHSRAYTHGHIHAPLPVWAHVQPLSSSAPLHRPAAAYALGLGICAPDRWGIGHISDAPGSAPTRVPTPPVRLMTPRLPVSTIARASFVHGALSPDTAGTLAARATRTASVNTAQPSSPLISQVPTAKSATLAPLPHIVLPPGSHAKVLALPPSTSAGASLATRRKARFTVLPTFIGAGPPPVATTPRIPSVRCVERVCTPCPRGRGNHDEWLSPTTALGEPTAQRLASLKLAHTRSGPRRVSFASVPSIIHQDNDAIPEPSMTRPGPAVAGTPALQGGHERRRATLSLGSLVREPLKASALASRTPTPYRTDRTEWLLPGPRLVAGREGVRRVSMSL